MLSLALALLAFPLAPTTAQPPATLDARAQDVEELLRERLAAAESFEERELWQEAAVLADLSLELEESEMDQSVDALLAGDEPLGPRGVLLLVATRMAGEEPDYDLLARRLGALVEDEDPLVVRSAAGLLADARFGNAAPETLEPLLAVVLDAARDIDRDPKTRLELAVTAWLRGGGREKREARTEMRAFLDSSDPELRSLAALALARVTDLETARPELERISSLPGPEGLLAQAYLKQEDLQDYYDGKIRKLRESIQEILDGQQPEDLDRIENLIRTIQMRHIEGDLVTREDLLDSAMDGMLHGLDAHSSFMPSDAFTRFQQDLEGEYGGIGAYVEEDPDDHVFTITRPIYSGPAYKASLRSDDKIVRIDDWPTIENGRSKELDDIIERLKGKPGTSVKLYIWRDGMDVSLIPRPTEEMAVEITRELITIPPMSSDVLPGEIGLLELSTFSGVASQELETTIEKMLAEGVKALILDLRNNSGGLLDEAQAVSELFLPRGKLVVTTEERSKEPSELRTRREPVVPAGVPVVLLIDRFSASASEIVAGALQDHGRARLVGERSYGKGSVQHLIPLGKDDQEEDQNGNGRWDNWEPLLADADGDGHFDFAPRAKLTIARWRIPSGKSIHRELDDEGNIVSPGGVAPDFEVEDRRWDGWRLELMLDDEMRAKVREWVVEQWPVHRERFQELAYGDGKDPLRYPGFEEFYASLGTILPREDVRFLVRTEVRRLVQDDRGSAFPRGDFQEDLQLQRAIEVALEELGSSYKKIEPYLLSFDSLRKENGEMLPGSVPTAESHEDRQEIRDALSLLARARRGELELKGENLERLDELLSKLDQ